MSPAAYHTSDACTEANYGIVITAESFSVGSGVNHRGDGMSVRLVREVE